MTDFLIVGRGLAAWTLAHTLAKHKKSFKIIGDKNLSRSSYVAAGIWNPVVFKRMTSSWMAQHLVEELLEFYKDCEKILDSEFVHQRHIIKPFSEEQEKVLWLKKAKNELSDFISPEIKNIPPEGMKFCKLSGEYGAVLKAGNIDLPLFLEKSEEHFCEGIIDEYFNHALLNSFDNSISYKDMSAKAIVFCEGHLVKENPFFNWLPLKPAKGEILTVTSEADPGDTIFNRDGFIFKNSSGEIRVGATYEWNDMTDIPTEKGREQLEGKLKNMILSPYKILKQEAGVRPSSSDRRPLIGRHPEFPRLFIFNGLGTKGVMLAPYFANNFVLFCLENQDLNPEADIKRFYSLYRGVR